LSAHLVLPKISKEVSRKIRIGNFHGVAGSKACATYPRQCKRQSEIIDVVCRAPRTTASAELQNDRQPLAEIPYRCTYPRSDRLSQIRCLQKRLDIRCFHQKDLFHRGSAANRTNLCRKKNPFGVAPHLQRGRPSSLCRTGSSRRRLRSGRRGRCPFIECIQWRGFPLYDGFNRPKNRDMIRPEWKRAADSFVLRDVAFGSDCDQRTVKSMSTEPQRTCPSCGNLSIMRGLPQLRTKSKASGARERSCLSRSLPPPTTRGTDFRFAPARRSSRAYSNLRTWRTMAHCQTESATRPAKVFHPPP
jgi:hypothetical protein